MSLMVARSSCDLQAVVYNCLDRLVLMVDMHVQHSEESIWVAIHAIGFDSGTYRWLRQNEVCKFVSAERVRILLEQLV